jgi:ABC-type transport system substrate-binding protein
MNKLLLICLLVLAAACSKKTERKKTAFYYNLRGDPTTINPITSTDAYASNLHGFVFDTLLGRDDDSYEWKAALAESWNINKTGDVFTFKLREGITFHDGKPITPEDVKFSFDVIFDPAFNTAHLRPYYEGIKEVKIVDKRTVQFIAKTKYYKNFDTAAGLEIKPKHFYGNKENKNKWNKEIIGSGPYVLAKYEKGKKFVLKKFTKWYGNGLYKDQYKFNKIIMKFISDSTVKLEMFKKKQLDYIAISPEEYVKKTKGKEWGESVHKIMTKNKTPKGYSFIGWNFKNVMFKDKKVRKALAHLVNRKLMIDKFEFGYSVPATGPVYPSSAYADSSIKPIPFSPKEAKRLLTEAGWADTDKDGILDKMINGKKKNFSFTILEPWKGFEKYLTIFKEDAKKQGIEIIIKIIEWNSFIKLIDERKFEAIRLAWSASIDWDPKQIWHSSSIKGGSNFISYSNKEVDRLTDKARLIKDRATRVKVLHKALKLIVNDYPYVFFTNKEKTMYGYTDGIVRPKDTFKYTVGTNHWKLKAD